MASLMKKMNTVPTDKTGWSSAFFAGASGLFLFTLAPLHAQVVMPTNPVVTQGGIAIQQTTPNLTTITQSTQKAIINWNNFSIGSGNTVQFNQPGSSAIAVNRVTGSSLSQIDGNLLANGQVWILNPNGVLIGGGGQINTAGFLGTTANLSDADFMAGNYRFTDASSRGALLQNKGSIFTAPGGYAVLAGRQVSNEGLIQANLGSVVLGGASSYALDVVGDKLLSFAVTAPIEVATANGKAVLENSGTLQADGGRIQLSARTAKDVIGGVINTTGLVQANNVALVNGAVVLDAGDAGSINNAGTISVNHSLGKGGAIAIHGGSIVNSGVLTANGQDGGRIDMLARDSINQSGSIQANAIASGLGNGGAVALIANLANAASTTIFSGSITARAGDAGGNGGLIETSGSKLKILDSAMVDTRAPKGRSGKWLLDPADITIGSGPDDLNVNSSAISGSVSAATIERNLTNSNVEIATSSAGSNININAPITWASYELILKANDSININATLNAKGTATLKFIYGQDTANGGTSTYNVSPGAQIFIPEGAAFKWQKGSSAAEKSLVLMNEFLMFGDGVSTSVMGNGNLAAPHYFDASSTATSVCGGTHWCPFSFSNMPVSYAVGMDGTGTSWNNAGTIISNGKVYSEVNGVLSQNFFGSTAEVNLVRRIEITNYKENLGSISVNFTTVGMGTDPRLAGLNFTLTNTFKLANATSRFLETDSSMTNLGNTALSNVRFWAGIGNDWVGSADNVLKTKGNFTGSGSAFTPITTATSTANAVLVSGGTSPLGFAMLYSPTAGVNSVISQQFGSADLTHLITIDPLSSLNLKQSDGAYGLFKNASTLAVGSSTNVLTLLGAVPATSFQVLGVTATAAAAATSAAVATAGGATAGSATETPTLPNTGVISEIVFRPPVLAPPLPPPPPSTNGSTTSTAGPVSTQQPGPPAQQPMPPPPIDADGMEPAGGTQMTMNPPPPSDAGVVQGPAPAPTSVAGPSSVGQPPPANIAAAGPAPVPTASSATNSTPPPRSASPVAAPVAPIAVASTPVAPPPPSPVGDVKPPTPKDAADTGDKTLAAAAPAAPSTAAAQPKRSTTSSGTVKIGSVSVQAVAQVNVPAAAGELRFSLAGNSAAW